MINCPSCDASLEEDADACFECGFAIGEEQSEDPWVNRVIAGRFRIIGKLGDGGMGEVYRAIQEPMGRSVAVKILNDELAEKPSQVERFKREAQAASQLSHPNTIVVHDFGQDDDGTLFIAMELLEGRSLADVLQSNETISAQRLVHIISQICDSLQEAHNHEVVHRDLKPENIFLTHRGEDSEFAKVLDFGIAKLNRDADGEVVDRLTRVGTICGTPHYMAPEQIRDATVDWRADIYALGVLIYYALAGTEPFDATKLVDVLTMHLNKEPPPIDWSYNKGDKALQRIEMVARKALEKDRNDRPQSARELREMLAACLTEANWASNEAAQPIPPPLRWTRNQQKSLGIGLALVFGVILLLMIFSDDEVIAVGDSQVDGGAVLAGGHARVGPIANQDVDAAMQNAEVEKDASTDKGQDDLDGGRPQSVSAVNGSPTTQPPQKHADRIALITAQLVATQKELAALKKARAERYVRDGTTSNQNTPPPSGDSRDAGARLQLKQKVNVKVTDAGIAPDARPEKDRPKHPFTEKNSDVDIFEFDGDLDTLKLDFGILPSAPKAGSKNKDHATTAPPPSDSGPSLEMPPDSATTEVNDKRDQGQTSKDAGVPNTRTTPDKGRLPPHEVASKPSSSGAAEKNGTAEPAVSTKQGASHLKIDGAKVLDKFNEQSPKKLDEPPNE